MWGEIPWWLYAIVIGGGILIIGLAFNLIRPGQQQWFANEPVIEDPSDPENFLINNIPSWRDSH